MKSLQFRNGNTIRYDSYRLSLQKHNTSQNHIVVEPYFKADIISEKCLSKIQLLYVRFIQRLVYQILHLPTSICFDKNNFRLIELPYRKRNRGKLTKFFRGMTKFYRGVTKSFPSLSSAGRNFFFSGQKFFRSPDRAFQLRSKRRTILKGGHWP